jgi:hypothetical protein
MPKPTMTDRFKSVIRYKVPDPIQRTESCPPQEASARRPGWPPSARERSTNHKKNAELRAGSPPFKKTVKVPIDVSMGLRGGAEKGERKQQPPPPPLPTSPRPHVPSNPAILNIQREDDKRRPISLPATPRNEGFRYPGSDLLASSRQPPQARRYGDEDLPVFNNGIGGGPVQRYAFPTEGGYYYQPMFPGPSSASRPYNADVQPPKRPYSRNV